MFHRITITAAIQIMVSLFLASNGCALEVFFNTEVLGHNNPIVRVKTNLPENTKVAIRVSNEKLGYDNEINTAVLGGSFESGPFLYDGGAMRAGTYTLEIAVELAQFQPESVQAVIGSRGENLEGSFARRGMLGTRVYYSKTLETRKPSLSSSSQ